MYKLKAIEATQSNQRISSIDILRCIALLLIMFLHFNSMIPFGFIGVELFFVISGVLVGGILIRDVIAGQNIRLGRFIIQRGFKIWPSYYLFIFLGHWLGGESISFEDNAKYIFFYQNYTGDPSHLWSLCVEEHFYILLPFLLLAIQKISFNHQMKLIFWGIVLMIIAGIGFKFLSYYFTNSQETSSGTHNRLDAFAWGLLFIYQISNKKITFNSITSLLMGIGLLTFGILFYTESVLFQKIIFPSLLPFSFYLILRGIYFFDFSSLKLMRLIAYYSYNIFLWHCVVGGYILNKVGTSFIGVLLFFIISFTIGVILTILIEEPFLKLRKKIIK